MTGTVTTWLDGRAQTVPADDPRLLEQEETRKLWMHCANMRRLPLHGRQEYLANVGRRGIGWQRRLRRSGRRGSLTPEVSRTAKRFRLHRIVRTQHEETA